MAETGFHIVGKNKTYFRDLRGSTGIADQMKNGTWRATAPAPTPPNNVAFGLRRVFQGVKLRFLYVHVQTRWNRWLRQGFT